MINLSALTPALNFEKLGYYTLPVEISSYESIHRYLI